MICESNAATDLAGTLDAFHAYLFKESTLPLFLSGEALFLLKAFPDNLIDFCMTSPPYWNKRQYQNGGIIIICPHRFLEKRQIFTDCLHLLSSHEPGNQLHIVSEIGIPGGSVDYFLVSARDGKVKDFVGIEF